MDNFQIKERIRELRSIIYNEYSGIGGALHIVLDDYNVENSSIEYCLNDCISKIEDSKEKEVYTECAKLLLKLSYSSRKRLVERG